MFTAFLFSNNNTRYAYILNTYTWSCFVATIVVSSRFISFFHVNFSNWSKEISTGWLCKNTIGSAYTWTHFRSQLFMCSFCYQLVLDMLLTCIRHVLEKLDHILGLYPTSYGLASTMFCTYIWLVLDIFCIYIAHVLYLYRTCSGLVLNMYWIYIGRVLRLYRMCSALVSDTFWTFTGVALGLYRKCFGLLSGMLSTCIRRLINLCWCHGLFMMSPPPPTDPLTPFQSVFAHLVFMTLYWLPNVPLISPIRPCIPMIFTALKS